MERVLLPYTIATGEGRSKYLMEEDSFPLPAMVLIQLGPPKHVFHKGNTSSFGRHALK